MATEREREDGWEGDLITNLLISGKGEEQRVWILTDQGKYTIPRKEIRVNFATDEYSMPLFDPEKKIILIGMETELSVSNKDASLVEKVVRIALRQKAVSQ